MSFAKISALILAYIHKLSFINTFLKENYKILAKSLDISLHVSVLVCSWITM